jgi:hypothetical protein
MLSCMLIDRIVAAADMTARKTEAQVHPLRTYFVALFASLVLPRISGLTLPICTHGASTFLLVTPSVFVHFIHKQYETYF